MGILFFSSTIPYVAGVIALNEGLEFDLKTEPDKMVKPRITQPKTFTPPPVVVEPKINIQPTEVEPYVYIDPPPPPPPPEPTKTRVDQYGVGKVLYEGNGAVIDYGFHKDAETVITVPKEQVKIVRTAIKSGVMGDVFTGTLHKELTVQAEEEEFTEEKAEDLGVTATSFFTAMNAFGSNKHSFAFPSTTRSTKVVRSMMGSWP